MSATGSLMMRAEAMTDEVERKIREDGGEVVGTIGEIRRHLSISGSNNVLRETLGILCRTGRMTGAPLRALSQSRGLPYTMYRYVLVPVRANA